MCINKYITCYIKMCMIYKCTYFIYLFDYISIISPPVGHKLHENINVFLLTVMSSGLWTVPETQLEFYKYLLSEWINNVQN